MQNQEKEVVLLMDQPAGLKQNPDTDQSNNDPFVAVGEEKHTLPSRTKILHRLNFSKTKSRFLETNYPYSYPSKAEDLLHEPTVQEHCASVSTDDEEDEDELEEEYEGKKKMNWSKKRKIKWRLSIEWALFFVFMTALICSLTKKSLKDCKQYGIEIWKWCLMIMGIICGRLVSGWVVRVLVFFIERNYMLREKVLYFVYGLRKSFQNCVWLCLVLLAWSMMFSQEEVQKHHKILKTVFKALIGILIGATIWLIKIVLVKVSASSFHVATFFDRMKESVFHHYILESLSGTPLDAETVDIQKHNHNMAHSKSMPARLRYRKKSSMKRTGSRKIDMEELRKLSMESTASAWSVKRLVNYVMSSGLSIISKTVDDFGKAESKITSEWEARACAQRTFKNVAKQGAKYIEEEDLMRFLRREEIHAIFPLFEGALETGQIRKSAFRNWVVRAYLERKSLAHSLNDTKTAVQQLHKLASAIVIVIDIVVFLLVMGLDPSKILVVVTSQFVVLGFMFQNTCKTVFESVIFVFVMHPFDVGDRCVIDGVQMIVEEMNILTTVFLRYDNEKIFYPNSTLSTKPISNFYRSPEMGDTIDFTIDVSTSMDNITTLKKHIQVYIESKPKYWNPKHSVIVKEIENVDKMKMCVSVLHTMNHQNYGERNARRSELVLELKKIFEKLEIKYHVLPQEVYLTQVNAPNIRTHG